MNPPRKKAKQSLLTSFIASGRDTVSSSAKVTKDESVFRESQVRPTFSPSKPTTCVALSIQETKESVNEGTLITSINQPLSFNFPSREIGNEAFKRSFKPD